MCECQYCGDRGEKECPLVQAGAQVALDRRLDGGERQRATSQKVRLEGNSPMGVTPLRRTTSHHGNDGELVVTPIISREPRGSAPGAA